MDRNSIPQVFGTHKPVVGMIHVSALPGTPGYGGDMKNIIAGAVSEARQYRDAGIDALAIENMHDRPYLKRAVGPEIVAAMAVIGYAVKQAAGLPTGIQILAGANQAALAAALVAGLDFARTEGFVFGHLADEGLIESDAGELLRYRRQIGADHIPLLTDIKKKHSSHAITMDIDISETARAAEFFQSDGIVITGSSTGRPAAMEEIVAVREAIDLPVFVGSGITAENVNDYLPICDGLIVGSYLKVDGRWYNQPDSVRIGRLLTIVHEFHNRRTD
ncbi:MAG: BtpA/SgcQ family protein [Candidatus Neomarinimicrobiota bacterium]